MEGKWKNERKEKRKRGDKEKKHGLAMPIYYVIKLYLRYL